jgi:hypothetical protein
LACDVLSVPLLQYLHAHQRPRRQHCAAHCHEHSSPALVLLLLSLLVVVAGRAVMTNAMGTPQKAVTMAQVLPVRWWTKICLQRMIPHPFQSRH